MKNVPVVLQLFMARRLWSTTAFSFWMTRIELLSLSCQSQQHWLIMGSMSSCIEDFFQAFLDVHYTEKYTLKRSYGLQGRVSWW